MFQFFKKNKQTSKSQDNLEKITLKINGMHCTSCSLSIDGEIEDLPGVIDVHTNYARAETKVEFNNSKVSIEKIKKVIEKLGYTIN